MENNQQLINIQKINLNNYTKSNISNINYIWNNINTTDEFIINSLYNHINNIYQKKINIINFLLNSFTPLPINSFKDLIHFFSILSPLNIEYFMSSREWNRKVIDNTEHYKIFFQNSISKHDCKKLTYINYIDKIKKTLNNANIKYNYFEFKSKRYNKSKDIIFVFDLNQFN